ncbi:hypothetical protein BH24ACT15_BH24ACT15_13510 [soil metagenome]
MGTSLRHAAWLARSSAITELAPFARSDIDELVRLGIRHVSPGTPLMAQAL